MTWAATILTLYPEMFPGPLGISLAGRALAEGKWSLNTVQIRDFATEGLDVFWDTTREPDFERAVPLLKHHGRIILMAGFDAHPTFPVGAFYTKDCSLHGFAITNATTEELRLELDRIRRQLGMDAPAIEIGRQLDLQSGLPGGPVRLV